MLAWDPRHNRVAAYAGALAIVVLAALLRLDAFVGKYGPLEHPAWARVATHQIAPLVRHIRPGVVWTRVPAPYVNGDPINYLAYAREMQSFYQPHVREPVFLALTRLALWSLDGQDAAVSLASAAGSVLAVFATYLLGAALLSRAAGLLAALLLAIEFECIIWAPDGWRDDTFTAMVVLAAWALLRLYQRPSFRRGAARGSPLRARVPHADYGLHLRPPGVRVADCGRGPRSAEGAPAICGHRSADRGGAGRSLPDQLRHRDGRSVVCAQLPHGLLPPRRGVEHLRADERRGVPAHEVRVAPGRYV